MIDYPKIQDPEAWQETETVYGRESALRRRTLDRVRWRPKTMEMRFVLRNGFHSAAAPYREPITWERTAKTIKRDLDGNRMRIRVMAETAGNAYPIRYDPFPGRYGAETGFFPLYYEGLISVGALQAQGRRAELVISAKIDPWVKSDALTATVSLSNVYTAENPKTWQQTGLGMPYVPMFEVHTTRESGAVPAANRIYVRIAGGEWYPLFFTDGNGSYVDSDYMGDSFAPMEGDVDWDHENKRFVVLPIAFPVTGALQLEFSGKGSVVVHWKVGERV